jgi:hypothetical protein
VIYTKVVALSGYTYALRVYRVALPFTFRLHKIYCCGVQFLTRIFKKVHHKAVLSLLLPSLPNKSGVGVLTLVP